MPCPITGPIQPSASVLCARNCGRCRYNTEARPLHFQHMLSVMSAFKVLKPDSIYFHTNIPPIGPYWQRVLALPTLKV